jgi:hypothetical protein
VETWAEPFQVDAATLERLASCARDFMRETLSPRTGAGSDYLHGLLDSGRLGSDEDEQTPVHVFTLNYDRLVEDMAVRFGVRHSVGFAEGWDPDLFDLPGLSLCLYKLHGSVDWYRLPARNITFRGSPEHPAFKGEASSDVLLYPTRGKNAFADPFATLVSRFNTVLASATYCVAVGYSFQDAHIRRIVIDRMITNRNLQLLVVGPHAEYVFQIRPEEQGEPTFSQVAERVCGLWQTARYALENRTVRHRIREIEQVDNLFAEVSRKAANRQFGEAASGLLNAVEACRAQDLPHKPRPRVTYPFGTEMRENLDREIGQRLKVCEERLNLDDIQWLGIQSRKVQKAFIDAVQLWIIAAALSLDEKVNAGRTLLRRFAHEVTRGTAFVTGNGFCIWGMTTPWRAPEADTLSRLQHLKACLGTWDAHPPIPDILDAADQSNRQAYEALSSGLSALRSTYEILLSGGMIVRKAGDMEYFAPRGKDWQAQVAEPSSRLLGSGFAEHWLGARTVIAS